MISPTTTACMIPPSESRRNGDSPVSAAHSIAPSDHRSDSGPVRSPAMRSGAVYSGEPTKEPVSVSVVAPLTCAIPKSVSTTRSLPASTSTFAGFRSRCSTPAACATRSAPSSAIPIRAASRASTVPVRESRSASEPPSINSMTMYGRSPCSTTSWTTMTFGWLSWATARASRRVRSFWRRASSAESVSSSTSSLTATCRPSSWSEARHTTPIPPRPIRASSR